MKPRILLIISMVTAATAITLNSCKSDFLNQLPQGVYDLASLNNKKGLDGMLINAYATLDGQEGNQNGGASNWLWGSIRGGDAYKGTEPTDMVDANPVMRFEILPGGNGQLDIKFAAIWDGVGEANVVLRNLPNVKDITPAQAKQVEAEAKFLRGFQHFEGAYDNLNETVANVGRANKWAAAAFLAKAYMYQNKFAEAKALFDLIIANGKTSRGIKYDLTPNYQTNFRALTENNQETVFSIQASYGDGANTNGNYDNTLNYPHGGSATTEKPGACCGFFQPSQNLVNSYQTDAAGLPMPNTYDNVNLTSDEFVPSSEAWNSILDYKKDEYVSRFDPAAPKTDRVYIALSNNKGADPLTSAAVWSLKWVEPSDIKLDPRLDWTVGRRGIPYYDWGVHPGRGWIRKVDYGGPFSPKKNTYYKADIGSIAGTVGWGFANNALNYTPMRFADVLLMAAEAEIEIGSLSKAREYINRVRVRAAASPVVDGATNAANYLVGQYTTEFPSKEEARKIVRFERKLELGMEGHRFFDLVRWGIADVELNGYLTKEGTRRVEALGGAKFVKGKHEYLPIPAYAITQSIKDGAPTLKQNPGY